MATVQFTSSESFMENHDDAIEKFEVEISDYIEGTYNDLRSGPNGDPIAIYDNGSWMILENGRRASDWAVKV
jgi:hypothetical protein